MNQFRALLCQTFVADVRSLEGHVARAAAALLTAAVFGPLYGSIAATAPGSPGLTLFIALTAGMHVLSMVAGCYLFARIIAEEQSRETYGLLLLTGIDPSAFVLARSISRLVLILLAISVTIPFWFLCVAFGGIVPVQVLASAIVLLVNLIVVSQIGTVSAACFAGQIKPVIAAVGATMAYSFLVVVLLPAGAMVGLNAPRTILSPGFNDLTGTVLWSLMPLAVAVALFSLARWVLARHRAPDCSRPGRLFGGKKLFSVEPGSLLRPHVGRAWQAAITWKEFYDATWGWRWYLFTIFVVTPLIAASLTFGFGNALGTSCLVTASLLAAAVVCEGAAQMFGSEVRHQTWDSLRLVPISLRTLMWKKILGRLPDFVPGALMLGAGIVLASGDRDWLLMDVAHRPEYYLLAGLCALAAGALTLVVLCYRSLNGNVVTGIIYGSGTLGLSLAVFGPLLLQQLNALTVSLVLCALLVIVVLTSMTVRQIRRTLEGDC